MSFKKAKILIAQLLIVTFILPNMNVKAMTNNTTSVIQSENKNEENINNIESIANEENNSLNNTSEESTSQDSTEDNEVLESENKSEVVEEESAKEESTEEESVEEKVSEEKSNTESNEKVEENKENSTETLKGSKYTKVKAVNSNVSRFSMYSFSAPSANMEREEFKLKQEAIENLEVLQPMTEDEYELTIANADGSYEFLDSYNDINTAVNAANSISVNSLSKSQQPAVINSSGQVVYSTNQMARVLRYVSGKYTPGNVNIYSNSNRTGDAITYVNQSYMDDAPILDMAATSAKVMINGVVGWINNDKASGTYDMVVVPLNQAKNPSYYTVKNGELVHYISYDLVGTTGYEKILGKAPSILKEGVRYLSYDGQYFYKYDHSSQTSITNTLNTLISDYRAGVRTNSINKSNPYYVYYLYLPFRSQTVYSAADLNKYLNNHSRISKTSKLYNLGQTFKDAETQYGVNAVLALAVAINESNYGNSDIAQSKNNLFGLKAYDSAPGESASSFATPKDSVVDFTKNYISRGYADPADWRYYGGFLGNKYRGANVKYASDPFWGEKAASFAYEIDKYLSGGNSALKDTNSKQIGMARTNNTVINKSGTLLYNVTDNTSVYGAYVDTPFVISDLQKVTMNGKTYYEIYPERNTAVGAGGEKNKYHGNYNWNDRGYILSNNISLINVFTPAVETKYGSDRYSTAVELSKSNFTSAETIVISNGYAIPDGLTATPIASYYNAPLLLVAKSSIPTSTQNEIKRLATKNVIIVGGTGVVDKNVETQLKNLGVTKITRLGGANRYETALQVAKYIDTNLYDVENIVIANGLGEADALSIAPISGRDKMPIILVQSNNIPSNINSWLKSESLNNAYIIGGTTAVSNNVLNSINSITKQNISGNRLGGANRYETNAKIIERFYGNVLNNLYVTEGLELVDALSSGPVAALNKSPVVISGKELTSGQKSVLKSKTTSKIIQVGGQVSKTVINNIKELLSRTE